MDAWEPCSVELLAPGPAPDCKFMANRVAARVAFLEARMLGFVAALEAAEGAPASMPVHMPSQACPFSPLKHP